MDFYLQAYFLELLWLKGTLRGPFIHFSLLCTNRDLEGKPGNCSPYCLSKKERK